MAHVSYYKGEVEISVQHFCDEEFCLHFFPCLLSRCIYLLLRENWKSAPSLGNWEECCKNLGKYGQFIFVLTSQVCGMSSIINIINNNGIYYYSFFHGGREQGFGDNKLDNLGQDLKGKVIMRKIIVYIIPVSMVISVSRAVTINSKPWRKNLFVKRNCAMQWML